MGAAEPARNGERDLTACARAGEQRRDLGGDPETEGRGFVSEKEVPSLAERVGTLGRLFATARGPPAGVHFTTAAQAGAGVREGGAGHPRRW